MPGHLIAKIVLFKNWNKALGKKTIIFLVSFGLIGIIYYILNDETLEQEKVTVDTFSIKPKKEKISEIKLASDNKPKKLNIALKTKDNSNIGNYKKDLESVLEVNRREVEECEDSIDRLIGGQMENDSSDLFNEDSVVDYLDEFDRLKIVPKSSGRLLELLTKDQIKKIKIDDFGSRLKELRPCRPYKKMSFIHGLMSNLLGDKWSDTTKDRARSSIFKYFSKELESYTTISNLNMLTALLQTMVSEGLFGKQYEEKVAGFKEDLEEAYDDLLDKADDMKIEDPSTQNFIPVSIIKNEFKLADKFRKDLIQILFQIRKEKLENL